MDNDGSHNDLLSLVGLSDDDDNNNSVFTIDFKISNDGYDDDLSFDFDENVFLKDEGYLMNDSNDENGDEALTEDIEEVNKMLNDKDALIIKSSESKQNNDNNTAGQTFTGRNERRRRYEKKLKLRNMKFPENDVRRTMMQKFMKYYTSRDFISLKTFLDENSLPQLLSRFIVVPSGDTDNFILPNKTEIRGIDNLINLGKTISKSMPDELVTLTNIIVKCGLKFSSIHADFTAVGTAISDVILNTTKNIKDNMNIRDSKKKKIDDKDIISDNNINVQINLSELSNNNDNKESFLDLSDQGNDYTGIDKYNFVNSSLKKDIKTYTGDGKVILYLDSEHRIHLFEYNLKLNSSFPCFRNFKK